MEHIFALVNKMSYYYIKRGNLSIRFTLSLILSRANINHTRNLNGDHREHQEYQQH